MIPSRRKNRTPSASAAFTLVETMVSVAIGAILLTGTMNLYLATLRTSSRTVAQVSSTERASVTIAKIVDISRECYNLALPTDSSGFTVPLAGTSASNYQTTDGSAAALQLTAPSTGAISVSNSAGTTKTAGTDFPVTYVHAAGPTLTLYRSDGAGNPAPNTGQYLWEVGTPPGESALAAGGKKMAVLAETASIAAATSDAVTFVRAPGSTAGVPAVAIHVIASDYSAVNSSQSNESTSTQIVGKCVLLRNHP